MAIFWNQKFNAQRSLSVFIIGVMSLSGQAISARELALNIHPVTDNVWLVQGVAEELSKENHGNISNSAFIATGDGVVVIDTGTTHAYGVQLRKAIAGYTDEPVRWVLNTHHHPDHVFGNSAFSDLPIMALDETRSELKRVGNIFLNTLQQRIGKNSDKTTLLLPNILIKPGLKEFSGYPLNLMRFTGHTGHDLVIYDPQSGTLFAGDMLFWQRAPTTPHSPGIDIWLSELSRLENLEPKNIIPGHGPFSTSLAPIKQTREWLKWLDALMKEGVANGKSANALIDTEIPDSFVDMPLARYELTRSISHFYRSYENAWWDSDKQ